MFARSVWSDWMQLNDVTWVLRWWRRRDAGGSWFIDKYWQSVCSRLILARFASNAAIRMRKPGNFHTKSLRFTSFCSWAELLFTWLCHVLGCELVSKHSCYTFFHKVTCSFELLLAMLLIITPLWWLSLCKPLRHNRQFQRQIAPELMASLWHDVIVLLNKSPPLLSIARHLDRTFYRFSQITTSANFDITIKAHECI